MAKLEHFPFLLSDWTVVDGTGGVSGPTLDTQWQNTTEIGHNAAFRFYGGATKGLMEYDVSGNSYSAGWITFGFDAQTNSQSGDGIFFILKGAANDLFRLVHVNSTGHWKAEYNNGAGWTQIGADITSPTMAAAPFVHIQWNIADAGGVFRLYVDGVEHGAFTGDTLTTADTTVDTIAFQAPVTSTSTMTFSVPMVDGGDTRLHRVEEDLATSNGTTNTWTNGEANIDNYSHTQNVLDFIETDAAGEEVSFNMGTLDANFSGWTVRGVEVGFRANPVAEPGLWIKPFVRSGGTNYTVAGQSVQPTNQAEPNNLYRHVITNDPNTGSVWASPAAVDAAEFGFASSGTS